MTNRQSSIVITLFVMTLRPVNLQYPYPPQMFPMPPPLPIPIPVPGPMQIAVLPIPYPVTEETTTTKRPKPTTRRYDPFGSDGENEGGRGLAIAFPIPFMPLMPPPMPLLPPPCPKNGPCPPPPMPLPPFGMPGPGFLLPMGPAPAIVFPLPGFKKKDDDDDDTSNSNFKSKKYRRIDDGRHHHHHRPIRKLSRRRIRINGRNHDPEMNNDNDIKPMLSYISKHGKVKFTKRLTADDAEMLLNAGSKSDELSQDVFSGKDSSFVLTSDKEESPSFDNRRVMLRGIDDTLFLNQGKKELVFRPRSNKAISNLSISFLVN